MKWRSTGGGVDPYHLHVLRQWQGPYWTGESEPELPYDERTLFEQHQETGLPEERLKQLQVPTEMTIESPEQISADISKRGDAGLAARAFAAPPVFDFRDDSFLADLQQRLGVP